LLIQIGAKKRHGKDAHMLFSLIYFFAPFSIFYIPHNYVIPQAMPHAIPQTHSAFYPYRVEMMNTIGGNTNAFSCMQIKLFIYIKPSSVDCCIKQKK